MSMFKMDLNLLFALVAVYWPSDSPLIDIFQVWNIVLYIRCTDVINRNFRPDCKAILAYEMMLSVRLSDVNILVNL